MDYFEIKIYASTYGIEPLSNVLTMLGYNTFVVEDKSVVEEFLQKKNKYDWDYVAPEILEKQYKESNITLYMEADKEAIEAVKKIAEAIEELKKEDVGSAYGRLLLESRLVSDDEWKDKWKEYFRPSKISENIVVCPSWEKYIAEAGEKIIEIDPGMAFGTGTHATTRMCVKLLEKYIDDPEELLLDLGCGSGILSIAAALCGAKNIKGVDIDMNAVEASMENVRKNGFSDEIEISYGDVTKGLGLQAEIIVANLMAEMIVELIPEIVKHLSGRGIFISSGILSEKRSVVVEALKKHGMSITDILEEEGWCAISAKL